MLPGRSGKKGSKVVHGQFCIDFLHNVFSFYGMQGGKRQRILEGPVGLFDAPYADILEMPTYLFTLPVSMRF